MTTYCYNLSVYWLGTTGFVFQQIESMPISPVNFASDKERDG